MGQVEAAPGTSVPGAVSVSVDGHGERRTACRYSRLVVRLIYAGWLPQDDCSAGTVLLL